VSALDQHADALERAEQAGEAIEPFAAANGLDLAQGYEIQRILVGRRTVAGARTVGWKLSAVAPEAQRRIGVEAPVLGQLTSDVVRPDGASIDLAPMVNPQLEVELGLVLGADLDGETTTAVDVMNAVTAVVPSLDISDARVGGADRTGVDVVADRAATGVVVVGAPKPFHADVDLATLGVLLEVDGDVVGSGAGARLLGSPVIALATAARAAAAHGVRLARGDLILTGTFVERVVLERPVLVVATFGGGVGSVGARFIDSNIAR